MSDEKDLKAKAEELGQTMFESFDKARKEAEEKEALAKKQADEEAAKHATETFSFPKLAGAVNKAYGIETRHFDRIVERDFSPENVKQYVGAQKDKERQSVKTNLFFRALVGSKLYPHIPEFGYTLKALSEGTDADGGYLVDPEFRGEVLRQLHHEGIMRPEVNVMPTNKDSVQFNKEDGRPLVSWGSENTSISTTTAGLAQTTINVHRMNTRMYLSREVVADSDPSITDWIRSELVTAVRLEEDAVIIGGSGSGRPYGLSQLSLTTNVAGASLTFDDYVDLVFTLPVQYRTAGNAKFFMASETLRDAYKLQDTQGMPIYLRDLSGTGPGTLMGYPIVLHDNFPGGTIYFGDLKRTYILLDRQSLAVETSTEADDTFAKHQVQIKITERIGGNAVRTEGLIKGTGYSS